MWLVEKEKAEKESSMTAAGREEGRYQLGRQESKTVA
jgi:predicted transposase YdaD